jgi:hypothetical protein
MTNKIFIVAQTSKSGVSHVCTKQIHDRREIVQMLNLGKHPNEQKRAKAPFDPSSALKENQTKQKLASAGKSGNIAA